MLPATASHCQQQQLPPPTLEVLVSFSTARVATGTRRRERGAATKGAKRAALLLLTLVALSEAGVRCNMVVMTMGVGREVVLGKANAMKRRLGRPLLLNRLHHRWNLFDRGPHVWTMAVRRESVCPQMR